MFDSHFDKSPPPTFFQRLSEAERRSVLGAFTTTSYRAKEELQSSSNRFSKVGIVLSGSVRVCQNLSSGKPIIYCDLHPGALFGLLNAYHRVPRGIQYVAQSDAIVGLIGGREFQQITAKYPHLGATLSELLSGHLLALSRRLFEHYALPTRLRLYAELLREAKSVPYQDKLLSIAPMPKHAELAARIGTHREAITRELSKLQKSGVISRAKGTLIIALPHVLRAEIDAELSA